MQRLTSQVIGKFADLTQNPSPLDLMLNYDLNNVNLDVLRNALASATHPWFSSERLS